MAKRKAFTAKGIEALKGTPGQRTEVPDGAFPGLYVVIQPSGTKSWALRARYGGKPFKMTLGTYPAMGLAEAREAATVALEELEAGVNPVALRKAEADEAAKAEAEGRDKVKTLVGVYQKRKLATLKSGDQALDFLNRFIVKAWGDRNVQEIKRRDVIDLLDEIVDSGRTTTANRVLAHGRAFFNFLLEREVIEMSPFARVKPPVREKSRDRVLCDDEVRLFWRACDALGAPWGLFGQMLLLTGQRLNEVARMTDREVDGDTWSLPADRTKNHRAHIVPLTKAALAVLDACPTFVAVKGQGGRYYFTTTGRSPVGDFSGARDAIMAKMRELANEGRDEDAQIEIPHWTFHDLRRTCATGLARLGVAVRVTEATLNHVSGTGSGIVAVYQRHDFAGEKRAALEVWAAFVEQLVNPPPGDNVVPLRRGEGAA